jgi:two-component system, OmpR family, KDP operon response regulator KdpE
MNAKKILVVEDDQVTCKLMSGALQSAGYQVFVAGDAATAVRMARTEDPDLITLDIRLDMASPGDSWDGIALGSWLRRLRQGQERNGRPAMVVVSGQEAGDVIDKVASIGAHSFLPKPFDKQKLLEVVAEALKA